MSKLRTKQELDAEYSQLCAFHGHKDAEIRDHQDQVMILEKEIKGLVDKKRELRREKWATEPAPPMVPTDHLVDNEPAPAGLASPPPEDTL